MKDELHGEVMCEMVGSRLKTCVTDVEGDEQSDKMNNLTIKKSKGIKKSEVSDFQLQKIQLMTRHLKS